MHVYIMIPYLFECDHTHGGNSNTAYTPSSINLHPPPSYTHQGNPAKRCIMNCLFMYLYSVLFIWKHHIYICIMLLSVHGHLKPFQILSDLMLHRVHHHCSGNVAGNVLFDTWSTQCLQLSAEMTVMWFSMMTVRSRLLFWRRMGSHHGSKSNSGSVTKPGVTLLA